MAASVGCTIGFQALQSLLGAGAIGILYTLGTELFPTSVRSIGMGIVTAFGRIGAILGPLAPGIFPNFGTQISQIIYFFAVPLVLAALLALALIRVDPRRTALAFIIPAVA